MVALWKGIDATPDSMLRSAGLPVGRLSYSFNQIILAARSVGLNLVYRGGATWDVIRAELDAGRPVISLLRYSEISGNQDDFAGAHFWTVIGYQGEFVYVNDPDWWQPRRDEGARRIVPLAEFESAIGALLLETGNQAFQALVLA